MSGEAKPVTVIYRDGQWLCWGCKTPAGDTLPEMPPAAADAGSAHLVAAIPHKPGCVLS